ncbi:MAG: thioredoxin family protein [Acidimicrobiales bacterium]
MAIPHHHTEENQMRVELLYFDDCPNWTTADSYLTALAETGGFEVVHRVISTAAEAEAAQFRGSPTILVDGRDPFALGNEPFGLSCRIYQTPDGPAGSPTLAQLAEALGG